MNFVQFTRLARRSCALLAVSLLYYSCGPRIVPAPQTKNSQFTFNNPFTGCHNPASGTPPLTYSGSVLVFGADAGRNPAQVDFQTWTSVAGNPAAPVVLTVKLPKSGYFKINVTMTATQCSTCSDTQNCIQSPAPGGGTYAAKPKLEGNFILQTYSATRTFSGPRSSWIQNIDPNSCGCIVPL